MFNDFRFRRGGVSQQLLGSFLLIGMLFVIGCNAKKSTPTPTLTITKTHTGSFTQGQQNATYTVTVANTGTAATSGTVTVTETVPSGLTLVSMAGTGWTCGAGANTCTRADVLAIGSSYPTITVTVNVGASATTPQVNQVSVSGGGAANASGQDSTTIVVPVLSVAKTHTGNFTQGQQGATYTITVSNGASAAPTNATTVTVTDTVPSGLTLVSMSGTGWTCPSGGTTCTRTDVLQGGSSYPVITATVNVGASATSPQVNAVAVSGGGSASANGTDSTVILAPALSVTKSHSGNFTQGQTGASYTVTVSNSSAATAAPTNGTTVTVTDTAPTGLTIANMSGTGWTCVAPSCTRTDVLAVGASYPSITVLANVASNASTPQVNQVSVSGGGSATANASDSTTINEPVLSITKTHTGNFTQSQSNATYTVTVSNTGTLPTSGTVEVSDTVPSGETLVSLAGTGWTCPGTGGSNTCDRSDVLANGSNYPTITVTVNVTASASSPQVNQVTATGGGSSTANGSDSTTITGADPCAGAGTGSESMLSGSYAFVQSGFDNGQGTGETSPEPALVGGVLTFSGSGTITAGTIDMNLNAGPQKNLAVTSGTYKVGSDQGACMKITTSFSTQAYRIALAGISGGVASTGHMFDIDTAGPFTTGTMRKQSTPIPTAFSGNFAFGVEAPQNSANTNNSISGGKFASAGAIDFTSSTAFTETVDFNQNGQLNGSSSNTAWLTTTPLSITGGVYAISANGRGTFTFTPPGSGSSPVNAILYVVSSSEALILDADTQAANSIFVGSAFAQSGSFGLGSLNGTSVLHISSMQINGGVGSVNPPTSDIQIGTVTTNGSGGLNFFAWDINPTNTTTPIANQTGTGTIQVASNGRTTFTAGGGNHQPVIWLITANEGFFLGGSQGVEFGMIEPQTSKTVSTTAKYAFGTVQPQVSGVDDSSGVVTFNGTIVSGTSDDNSAGTVSIGNAFSINYSVDGTGLGAIGPSGCAVGVVGSTGCPLIFYVISPTRAALLELLNSSSGTLVATPVLDIVDQ